MISSVTTFQYLCDIPCLSLKLIVYSQTETFTPWVFLYHNFPNKMRVTTNISISEFKSEKQQLDLTLIKQCATSMTLFKKD